MTRDTLPRVTLRIFAAVVPILLDAPTMESQWSPDPEIPRVCLLGVSC